MKLSEFLKEFVGEPISESTISKLSTKILSVRVSDGNRVIVLDGSLKVTGSEVKFYGKDLWDYKKKIVLLSQARLYEIV